MSRLTTPFAAAASAGLTALAVTAVAPAIGADTASPAKDGARIEHRTGPSVDELRACLQANGATGVPGDEREGRALKEWIVARQGDESDRAALKACDVYFDASKPGSRPAGGPTDCAAAGGKGEPDGAAAAEKGRRVEKRGVKVAR